MTYPRNTDFERGRLAVLATASTDLIDLVHQMGDELAALDDTQGRPPRSDDLLTPAGRRDQRNKAVQAVYDRCAPRVTALTATASAAAAAIERWVQTERTQLGAPTATSWDQCKLRLDAGMSLVTLIGHATVAECLALREYTPAWLDAELFRNSSNGDGLAGRYEAPDPTAVLRAIDDRLGELAGGVTQEAFAASRQAHILMAGLDPMATYARQLVSGIASPGGAFTAVIESHMMAQTAEQTIRVEDFETTGRPLGTSA